MALVTVSRLQVQQVLVFSYDYHEVLINPISSQVVCLNSFKDPLTSTAVTTAKTRCGFYNLVTNTSITCASGNV
jgi:hypothetical protein